MTNRPAPASGAGQTRWAIVGLCAALIFAGGAVWWTQRDDATPSSPSTKSPTAEPSATPTNTVQPADGCLGGPDPEKAVLVAHDTAPITGDGAAAFLATYFRWHFLAPKSDPTTPITEKVWVADLDAKSKLPTTEELQENGLVSFGLTLVNMHYRVEEFTGDRATVAMTFDVLGEGGAISAHAAMIGSVATRNDHWLFAGFDHRRVAQIGDAASGRAFREELTSTGIPFQEAC